MANTIKIRRGLEAARSGITPAAGELIYVTDTNKVYIGDGTTAGGIEIGSLSSPYNITDNSNANWLTIDVNENVTFAGDVTAPYLNVDGPIGVGSGSNMLLDTSGSTSVLIRSDSSVASRLLLQDSTGVERASFNALDSATTPYFTVKAGTTNSIFGIQGGTTDLRYNGSSKISTTSTGIIVTGEALVTGGVDKLTTATGVVSVAAATAPTVGQVLTATSSTDATWQTAAGGGGGGAENVIARNSTLNQEAVTQGESTRSGFSATIYTGNGTSLAVNTGLDMASVDFGGLVWEKRRNNATSAHLLYDTVRGATNYLQSQSTAIEAPNADTLTSFGSTGFSLGPNGESNQPGSLHAAWSWQTTHKTAFAGGQLVTGDDSTFGTIGNWVQQVATASIVGGRLRTTGITAEASLAVSGLIIGNTYRLEADMFIGTSISVAMYVSTSASFADFITFIVRGQGNPDTGDGTSSVEFEATQTTMYLCARMNHTANNYTEFDNVTLVPILNENLTNRNKPYISHYNPDLGFSIVGYEGDGLAGHEIPHHLGVEPELSIFKARDAAGSWLVRSTSYIGADSYLLLDETVSATVNASTNALQMATTVSLATNIIFNAATTNYISYHFASVQGISKIGKYIGTGAAGNYVDCGFKPAFVMVKNLTTDAQSWLVFDAQRDSTYRPYLIPNTSGIEAETVVLDLDFTVSGFVLLGANTNYNAVNDEFLFMAYAESATGGSGTNTYTTTDNTYPTTADTLSIAQNTLIGFAQGFDTNGQVDSQENVGSGITYTLGVGFADKYYYIYKDLAGAYGVTENRPITGITRNDADKWGEVSPLDASLRTTAKHFDYESATGVASASEFYTVYVPWGAFDKDDNDSIAIVTSQWIANTTTLSWLQYKQTEKRVLKSWRMRSSNLTDRTPRRFTIEGSNDGLIWIAIDSTYTASDYVPAGDVLWNSLSSTSGNTIAYLYHRINITANNGDVAYTAIAELEFNTILPSDYYLINEGVQYSGATDLAINRTYLAEFRTDYAGGVINETLVNMPVAKQRFGEVEVHEDLTVHGEIKNRGACTAWVNFDGTQDPPLIRTSYNVSDVVKTSTGIYIIIFEEPMDTTGYAISVCTEWGSFNGLGGAGTNMLTGVTLVTANVSAVLNDQTDITVATFGGKEIK